MIKKLSILFALFILTHCGIIAQSTSQVNTSKVAQMLAQETYNSRSDINLTEKSIIDQLYDSKSLTIKLPFLREELKFAKTEYSIYGDKPSPWEEIKTYKIISKDDPLLQGRVVTGPLGVNITYFYNGKMIKIYPLEVNGQRSYFQELGVSEAVPFECEEHGAAHFDTGDIKIFDDETRKSLKTLGSTRRVYRVALSVTGEYYQANGNNNTAVANAAAVLLSDISEMFEREINIELVMAPGSPEFHRDPATDPYSNNPSADEALSVIPTEFNDNQYDIGHLLHNVGSGGAGNAGVGVVCTTSKARGYSSFQTGRPSGFAMLAAHEFGHQFGCPHTWNGMGDNCNVGNHSAGNAYEVGSGNTQNSLHDQ